MDIAGLLRVADAVMTAVLAFVALGGLALAWAVGLLPQVIVVLAAIALLLPFLQPPEPPR